MPNQDEHDNKTDQPLSSTDSDDTVESTGGIFKTLLFAIGGVVFLIIYLGITSDASYLLI